MKTIETIFQPLEPTPFSAANPLSQEQFAHMCKALGHPARLKILRYLIEVDRCICGEIVGIMPLAQSTVSQHLRILKDAGLVQGEIEGPAVRYCVDKEMLARFKAAAMTL